MDDGRKFKEEDGIPYPVLVDDLEGTVHQVYGGLADPTYLIDADGRVSFYNMWTHAPTLHKAIEELFGQGGRGIVKGEQIAFRICLQPPRMAGMAYGAGSRAVLLNWNRPHREWRAVRGGYQLRPLLAPIALRATPLPAPVKIGLGLGAVALLLLGARALTRGRQQPIRKARRSGARRIARRRS